MYIAMAQCDIKLCATTQATQGAAGTSSLAYEPWPTVKQDSAVCACSVDLNGVGVVGAVQSRFLGDYRLDMS